MYVSMCHGAYKTGGEFVRAGVLLLPCGSGSLRLLHLAASHFLCWAIWQALVSFLLWEETEKRYFRIRSLGCPNTEGQTRVVLPMSPTPWYRMNAHTCAGGPLPTFGLFKQLFGISIFGLTSRLKRGAVTLNQKIIKKQFLLFAWLALILLYS